MTDRNDSWPAKAAVSTGVANATRSWRAAAEDGVAAATAACSAYDRRRALPRLIGFDAAELANASPALDAAIQSRLKHALRDKRQRGVAGHWTYDLNRHLALMQALASEEGRHGCAGRARKRRPAGAGRRHQACSMQSGWPDPA